MNQEEKQPFNQASYLDEIAPVTKSENLFSQKPMLFAIIGLLLVIIIFAIGLLTGGDGEKQFLERLSVRLSSTEAIAKDATAKIKNTQLRTLNSNLKTYFANTNREISSILIIEKIDIKKIDKKIIAEEDSGKNLSTLENARLNAVYDRVYAREMSYKLETIMSLMKQIKEKTKDKKLNTFLSDAHKNLAPTQQQFSEFSADNG